MVFSYILECVYMYLGRDTWYLDVFGNRMYGI